jgi:pyridine nucleotide-disulfide oxidoreductase domain-containing protein 1
MVRNGDGDWPVALELSNGSIVLCDVVMCATGVTPNVEWLRGGLDVAVDSGDDDALLGHDASGGVLVKAGNMQSATQPSVFGAGDCVTIMRSSDMTAASGNNWFQMRLWTQAAATGRVAAAGMAAHLRANGSDADVGLEFELFAHGTRFFGQKVALLGRYNAQGLEGGYQVLEGGGGEDDDYFIRVVIEDGKVRGALLIGDTELSETYENLILDRFDVGHLGAELVDPSIDLSDVFDWYRYEVYVEQTMMARQLVCNSSCVDLRYVYLGMNNDGWRQELWNGQAQRDRWNLSNKNVW